MAAEAVAGATEGRGSYGDGKLSSRRAGPSSRRIEEEDDEDDGGGGGGYEGEGVVADDEDYE